MTFTPGDMPLPPITLTAARSSGAVRVPMVASEAQQEFGLSMSLEGVELSEAAWSMFDPAGVLPREPATLALEISGTGRLDVDVIDAAAMEAASQDDTPPGELRSVSLDRLRLALVGAELTGTGAFTFDNATVPPAPEGKIELTLTGANALIDKLVKMGLIPEDQAMGARMMIGMFAKPGEGEDVLTSTIEVRKDGSVIANGMQIK